MANWKIKLANGKNLRRAIDSGDDMVNVLTALEDCWREIHKKMPDEYDEDDLENDLDEIENQIDNAENYDDYGMSEYEVQEEIDYLLDQFYDFCDNARVWVNMD